MLTCIIWLKNVSQCHRMHDSTCRNNQQNERALITSPHLQKTLETFPMTHKDQNKMILLLIRGAIQIVRIIKTSILKFQFQFNLCEALFEKASSSTDAKANDSIVNAERFRIQSFCFNLSYGSKSLNFIVLV